MHRYKDLKVWQKAIELSTEVYRITRKFPKDERFGLISQINRAVISIPSNIAEGAGRDTERDFNHFLGIALGSSFELETQLVISKELEYIEASDFERIEKEIEYLQKMVFKLKKSLKL